MATTSVAPLTTTLAPDLEYMRAHGILMITAWILSASIGLFIARYYKSAWPNTTLFKARIWFTVHRVFMVATLLLDVASFILIYVDNQGQMVDFPPGTPGYQWAHPPIGIVVTILVIINPFMALFRCQPDHSQRWIFNWMHWAVGYSAHILGVINIFFGLYIYFSQTINLYSVVWLVSAFAVFHFIMEVLVHIYTFEKARRTPELKDLDDNSATNEKEVGKETDRILDLALFVYIAVVFGIWLAIVIIMSINN